MHPITLFGEVVYTVHNNVISSLECCHICNNIHPHVLTAVICNCYCLFTYTSFQQVDWLTCTFHSFWCSVAINPTSIGGWWSVLLQCLFMLLWYGLPLWSLVLLSGCYFLEVWESRADVACHCIVLGSEFGSQGGGSNCLERNGCCELMHFVP